MHPDPSPSKKPFLAGIGVALLAGTLGFHVFQTSSSRLRLNRLAATEPLTAVGREVYISEGCIHCHTQYVRPGTEDVLLWGPAANPARILKEQPPLIGNRRQGPDLMNVGNRRSAPWNTAHLKEPRSLVPGSRMPSYAYLFAPGDRRGEALVAYLQSLGADTMEQRKAQMEAWKPAADTKPIDPAAAAMLFKETCARNGDGTFGGDAKGLLLRSIFNAPGDDAARILKFGIPGTSIAGNETLTDGEILGLICYMRSLHPKEAGK